MCKIEGSLRCFLVQEDTLGLWEQSVRGIRHEIMAQDTPGLGIC